MPAQSSRKKNVKKNAHCKSEKHKRTLREKLAVILKPEIATVANDF